ncbi:unnamed protein product [Effrenium voratum]|uniref:Spondin-like TSP1 domain-containing protein n=1 Tax=Effrenium voratum TaxID=2562239 RepID=A0AA36NCZ5_9DINO|nr:unnamed protein product [Effrenium voratum]
MTPPAGMPARLVFLHLLTMSRGELATVHDLGAIGDYYVPLEHVCDGYQEQWDNCPELEKCGPCVRRDCILGPWSPWQLQGGCTGLQLRHREVEVQHNHCGTPCDGTLTETASFEVPENCKPKGKDCKFGAWGAWTECKDKKDQSMRTRSIAEYPEEGGASCEGALEETRPCGGPADTNCHVGDWHEWTSCSEKCGKGRRTRMRYIDEEAHHGGTTCQLNLLETAECEVGHCEDSKDCVLSDWGEWTLCDELYIQSYRHRQVLAEPEGHGQLCNASLKQTRGCFPLVPSDCVLSEWQPWTKCTATCDGGQMFRDRNILKPPQRGGTCPSVELRETQGCGINPCSTTGPQDCSMMDWAKWSDCSASCGDGSQVRSRKMDSLAVMGGKPCTGPLQEVKICKTHDCQVVDCRWSDWEQWSTCSVSCDGGTKTRSRNIAVSPMGGAACDPHDKVEVAPCGTQTCGEGCKNGEWGMWREWTPCSGTCNSAYRFRRRNIAVHANYCGNATVGVREEFEKCEELPPCTTDIDCEISQWASWTSCSCHCFGMRSRSRYISTFPSGNGETCFNEALKEIEPCNPGPNEHRPADCSDTEQQDCVLKAWEEWSQCTTSCGGGQRSRVRELEQSPMGGGKPCNETLLQTKGCSLQHCEEHRCQDCVWGPWSAWGQCPECGGQKYRHRNIDIMPNHCGRRCEMQSSKEVSDCPPSLKCTEKLFCAWNPWTSADCNGVCGQSTTMVTRTLGLHRNKPTDVFFAVNGTAKCAGAQVNQTKCPFTHDCQDCIPIPCTFSPWSEWQQPTCEGLCTRSRVVQNVNNECGTPCTGPLESTKRCAADCLTPQDCKVTEWSSWSGCSDPGQSTGQRYRSRGIIHNPRNGGKPCLGVLDETAGCHQIVPQPCMFSDWEEWTSCTATCGDGWRSRQRNIESHAHRGGHPCDGTLREIDTCTAGSSCEGHEAVDCLLGEWGAWSTCDLHNMMYRDKSVTRKAAHGGQPCVGETTQGQSCGLVKVDCRMSEWTTFGPCDRTCGEGQTRRQRQIERFSQFGGQECPAELMETRGCMEAPCPTWNAEVSDWTDWSSCSFTCGPGEERRERGVLKERSLGGRGFEGHLGEVRACHGAQACPRRDCVWNTWESWAPCSCSCGGGHQDRKRFVLHMPEAGGERCEPSDKIEIRACNTQPCGESACQDGKWGLWSAWAECSASCDGGTTFRIRSIAQNASACGCPAPGKAHETGICNMESCGESRDCIMSHWTTWGACSSTCNGIKTRERKVEEYGLGSGVWCSGGLKQVEPCNPSPGETASEQCAGGDPVDCVQSEWTSWSMCSVSCGGGEHLRERKILRHPKYGGRTCDGGMAELKECNRHMCGGPEPVDCLFSPWKEWGDCDKCNGERSRVRNIDSFPRYGGAECPPKSTMEIGKCPRRCSGEKFCEWTVWGEWSDCTVTCGKGGKRRRRRHLQLTEKARHELPDYVSNVAMKYEKLRRRAQDMEHKEIVEGVACFWMGCLVTFFCVGGVRASRARPRAAELVYEVLEEA